MKYGLALALVALQSIPAVRAQSDELSGRWVAREAPMESSSLWSNAASCARPPANFSNVLPQQNAELELTVDKVTETVTGSISLPAFQVYGECGPRLEPGCGRLTISNGRINGNSLSFTTVKKVNGSNIPTRWVGEITQPDGISLQALDTLPCRVAPRFAGPNDIFSIRNRTLLNSQFLTGKRVYRRGEDPGNRKPNSPAPGANGKWWTIDGGHVTTLDIKVNDKGKVTGSVSFCVGPQQKIEKGALLEKSITFETQSNLQVAAFRGPKLAWAGELIDNDTLVLETPGATAQCQLPSGVQLNFVRQGSKGRKYVA
jgi:hypothetical protein